MPIQAIQYSTLPPTWTPPWSKRNRHHYLPLNPTMNVSLANGCEGYIPPPEQFELGGYTTWRARTSCLEVQAEAKIRTAVLELLANVARS